MARFVDQGPLDPFTDAHLRRTPAVLRPARPSCGAAAMTLASRARRIRKAGGWPRLCSPRPGRLGARGPPAVAQRRRAPRCRSRGRSSCRAEWRPSSVGRPAWPSNSPTCSANCRPAAELDRRLADWRVGPHPDTADSGPCRPARALTSACSTLEVRRDGRMVDTPAITASSAGAAGPLPRSSTRTVRQDQAIDLPSLARATGRDEDSLRVTLRHSMPANRRTEAEGAVPYFVRERRPPATAGASARASSRLLEHRITWTEPRAARRRGRRQQPGRRLGVVAGGEVAGPADLDRTVEATDARYLVPPGRGRPVTLGELELVGGAFSAAKAAGQAGAGGRSVYRRTPPSRSPPPPAPTTASPPTAAIDARRRVGRPRRRPEQATQVLLLRSRDRGEVVNAWSEDPLGGDPANSLQVDSSRSARSRRRGSTGPPVVDVSAVRQRRRQPGASATAVLEQWPPLTPTAPTTLPSTVVEATTEDARGGRYRGRSASPRAEVVE